MAYKGEVERCGAAHIKVVLSFFLWRRVREYLLPLPFLFFQSRLLLNVFDLTLASKLPVASSHCSAVIGRKSRFAIYMIECVFTHIMSARSSANLAVALRAQGNAKTHPEIRCQRWFIHTNGR
jgi:hypothetical protein